MNAISRQFVTATAAVLLSLCAVVHSQSQTCVPPPVAQCATGTNFFVRTLAFKDGYFTGSIQSNQCPSQTAQVSTFGSPVKSTDSKPVGTCVTQTFPDPAYVPSKISTFGSPLPMTSPRSRIGLSLTGVNIYGAIEEGFALGQGCSNAYGTCVDGMNVQECQFTLEKACGSANVKAWNVTDTCGGRHTSPYRYVRDLSCEYASTVFSTHSPLIGVALDGRGIYGKYEGGAGSNTSLPVLDACNGHWGPVPATTVSTGALGGSGGSGTETFPAATNVYHYHTSDLPPFTLGCFGPPSQTITETLPFCKTITYATSCGNADASGQTGTWLCTSKGSHFVDTFCPCYRQGSDVYNMQYDSTSACPSCDPVAGCAAPVVKPTTAPPVDVPGVLQNLIIARPNVLSVGEMRGVAGAFVYSAGTTFASSARVLRQALTTNAVTKITTLNIAVFVSPFGDKTSTNLYTQLIKQQATLQSTVAFAVQTTVALDSALTFTYPATCQDGMKNGNEADVDCGGPLSNCDGCVGGSKCVANTDCISSSCDQTTLTCALVPGRVSSAISGFTTNYVVSAILALAVMLFIC